MTIKLDKLDTVTHVCAPDAYLEIFDHGLRSTEVLLRDHGPHDADRVALTRAPRPEAIDLPATNGFGAVRLAPDQLGSGEQAFLQKSLAKSGCTLEDYCALLSSRVHLWADFRYEDGAVVGDAQGFVSRVAVDGEFDVIRIPFFALKRAAAKQGRAVELTDLNSGVVPGSVTRRGPNTWTPIDDYARTGVVREVAVLERLDDVATFARSVVRYSPSGSKSVWVGGPWR
jgi:hypothetical protein